MDFGTWLLRSKFLTKGEFFRCLLNQRGVSSLKKEEYSEFVTPNFPDNAISHSAEHFRVMPFGIALEECHLVGKVLERAECDDLQQVISEWQRWHLENLEPISNYSTQSQFGTQLYVHQWEKKAVASFVVTQPLDDGLTLVRDTNCIVIPEGSSGLYVGLAAALHRKRLKLITTNCALIREYIENPAMRGERIIAVDAVGGEVDTDHLGTVGHRCQEQIAREMTGGDPNLTVLISSVTGCSREHGPCAPDGRAATTRLGVIDAALREGVRAVVFVADYTKHLAKPSLYENPIFGGSWERVASTHRNRICVVTCPPPSHRDYFAKNPDAASISYRKSHRILELNQGIGRQYEENIMKLADVANVFEAIDSPVFA